MKKYLVLIIPAIIILVFFYSFKSIQSLFKPGVIPTPTPAPLVQLSKDQYPVVSVSFSTDSHYATIKISNLHADKLEYNLIYDATVKKNQIQTGVNAAASLNGQTTYEKTQLLGSESSGKFTYHEKITNAVIELTLRDAYGRSVFYGNYPFILKPGSSTPLELQEK